MKLEHEEVKVRVLLSGVGQITESDVQLAKASSAVIVAFNVRATSQAREMATRDGVDIRYFSIIYEVSDDVEKLVRGKVAPKAREKFLGYAEVRQVFNITKTGKVAGCYITEGLVKRGAGVRVLRDNVVIHTGELSQPEAASRTMCARWPAVTNAACPSRTSTICRKATSSSALKWRWSLPGPRGNKPPSASRGSKSRPSEPAAIRTRARSARDNPKHGGLRDGSTAAPTASIVARRTGGNLGHAGWRLFSHGVKP